eukprot:COSAG02_NODE_86_length_39084_cov_17.815724_34_plen_76_part_00
MSYNTFCPLRTPTSLVLPWPAFELRLPPSKEAHPLHSDQVRTARTVFSLRLIPRLLDQLVFRRVSPDQMALPLFR